MARKVIWTTSALGDLEAAAEYIGRDSPHFAASLISEVLEAGRSLSSLSERGRHVPELSDPDLRELLIQPYRLIYRVGIDSVWVLALIHGRRDLETAWSRRRDLTE